MGAVSTTCQLLWAQRDGFGASNWSQTRGLGIQREWGLNVSNQGRDGSWTTATVVGTVCVPKSIRLVLDEGGESW